MKENKKNQEQRDLLIAQSNHLIRAKYNTSLWEKRLFIEMIQSIKQADTEFQWITFYYSDLVKIYGTTSHNDYDRITKAAKSLGQKVMFLPFLETHKDGRTEEREISEVIIQVDVPKRLDDGFRKYIKLKFNDKLKPLLLKLERDYFLYDKANIIGLRGKYTFDFYELFKQLERENKGVIKVYFSLEKFRNIFLLNKYGNATNKYKKIGDIEKYVIQPSQKEMRDLTDLSFSYEKVKEGRTVVGIEFRAYKNRKKKKAKQQDTNIKNEIIVETPEMESTNIFTSIVPTFNDEIFEKKTVQELIKRNVTYPVAAELSQKYDDEVILYTIKRADEAHTHNSRTNLAGFIVDSLKKGTFQIELQQQKKRQTKKRKEAEAKAVIVETDRQIRELAKQFEQEKRKKVAEIMKTLDEKEQSKIFALTREKFGLALRGASNEKILKEHLSTLSIIGGGYLTENGQMATIESDFYEWIEATHKVKIRQEGSFYKVVS